MNETRDFYFLTPQCLPIEPLGGLNQIRPLIEVLGKLLRRFSTPKSIGLPTSKAELSKYLSDEVIGLFSEVLDFDQVYGNLDLMKCKNGDYYIDSVYFGLPLKSLNLTGFVCDGIINDQVRIALI